MNLIDGSQHYTSNLSKETKSDKMRRYGFILFVSMHLMHTVINNNVLYYIRRGPNPRERQFYVSRETMLSAGNDNFLFQTMLGLDLPLEELGKLVKKVCDFAEYIAPAGEIDGTLESLVIGIEIYKWITVILPSNNIVPVDEADNRRCPICLEMISGRSEAIELSCGHRFHSQCSLDWMSVKLECPICQRKVPTQPPRP